jgi:hypothetical protein
VEYNVTVSWRNKKVGCHSANKHSTRYSKICMALDLKYVKFTNYYVCAQFYVYVYKHGRRWKTLGWPGKLNTDVIFPKYGSIFKN